VPDELAGEPSDRLEAVLATGRTDITTIFISMSTRHPEGRDEEYLRWHTLDHRPEQYRLPEIRASLRIVSTPECRAARAASVPRFDATDHVMTYLFSDAAGLPAFADLGAALRQGGRMPYLLPMVERGVYTLEGRAASPRVKVGADVLPWWPSRGIYLLVEQGAAPVDDRDLLDVPGVAGAWWAAGNPLGPPSSSADNGGLQATYLFLDGEPVETAERLRGPLEKRWADGDLEPLLAAPFHVAVPWEWKRYLP
jgi:hypothetical protein